MSATTTSPTGSEALQHDLLVALQNERTLYEALIDVTIRERNAIAMSTGVTAAQGPLALEQLVAEKERLIARLAEIERTRIAVSGNLAVSLGLARDTRLAALLPQLSQTEAQALQEERAMLLARLGSLAETNAANTALLNAALSHTRAASSYLQSLQGTTYQSNGRTTLPPTHAHRLDRQA